MLQQLQLGSLVIERSRYLPPILAPLVEAAESGKDLIPVLVSIVNGLGFDGFMYASTNFIPKPNNEARMYVFTTLPREWVMRYDQRAYVECDPRVLYSFESSLPLVWDQASERGKSARTDAFLDDAAAHGVASGISFSVHAGFQARVLVSLSSANPIIDEARYYSIVRNLGDTLLFGQYFHQLFMKGVVERGLAPQSEGVPLSPRELQCLEMAARGLTSGDIGIKLGFTERTAYFHFSNIISKLGVLNRQEAIAKAITQGIIQVKR